MGADLVLQWGRWADWWAEGGGLLLTVRATQAVSLLLAFVLAVKRPTYATARRAVWLLATLGVFSIVLPSRFAAVWRGIPPPFNLLLWIPFLSNAAVGAIFLTFFASFPRLLVRSRWTWAAVWTPIVGSTVSRNAVPAAVPSVFHSSRSALPRWTMKYFTPSTITD